MCNYWVVVIGGGRGRFGPFPSEIKASEYMDYHALSDTVWKIIPDYECC